MAAAHAELVPAPAEPPGAVYLSACFGANTPVGSEVGEGNGLVYTDFRVHEDGFSRFLVMDRRFTPVQAGRTLQRLFEIEAYRMLALLSLPIARAQAVELSAIERSLAALTDDMTRGREDDEQLQRELTRLAAEIESELASSQSRFGATRAYHELVTTRIAELRERRLPGIQTIGEFMARRLALRRSLPRRGCRSVCTASPSASNRAPAACCRRGSTSSASSRTRPCSSR